MERKELLERLRAQIHTDSYDVSVGEWIALYKQNELDLHPEFERFNCWSNAKKTRFIEKLLLAIPQAPILIMQRPDGVWDVYDGLERLSTIFQFMGMLKDASGNIVEPFALQNPAYLPLEAKRWELPDDPENSLNSAEQFYLETANLPAQIILDASYQLIAPKWFQQPDYQFMTPSVG